MKKLLAITLFSIPLALASTAYAQTTPAPAPAPAAPGGTGGGMTSPSAGAQNAPAPEPTKTVNGWSVKDKILGSEVYNEKNEKVGDIDDVVLADDGKAVYFVIGSGGFLGLGQHDVAIPFDKIQKRSEEHTSEL